MRTLATVMIAVFSAGSITAGSIGSSTAAGCVGSFSCDYYANTAIEQNHINRSLGCGYRGERWHNNHLIHKVWCDFNCDKMAEHVAERANALSRCWSRRNRGSGEHRYYWPRVGPSIGGGPAAFLAWCRFPVAPRGCGVPAAEQFCERHSYGRVANIRRQADISKLFAPIRHIGNWNLTDAHSHGFESITCADQILR